MIIHTVEDILKKLENCIKYKKSFSLIRFGDGGIKYIHSILYNDIKQLNGILKKEGIPEDKALEIFELWGYYARQADFIDTPEVYYNGEFWDRLKRKGKPINEDTEKILKDWRDLYNRAEFDNENYCNPESNCLMIVKIPEKMNLFDVMKNRKVCLITAKPEIKQILPQLDIIEIVGQWENQYENSFHKVVKIIKHTAKEYDYWLVAAGEVGRIYSGMIKEYGGRSLDIGFVTEYWVDEYIHPRLHPFLNICLSDKLHLVLTDEGKKYERYI